MIKAAGIGQGYTTPEILREMEEQGGACAKFADRLRKARNRESAHRRKALKTAIADISQKNKNILKWWDTLKGRDLMGNEDACNFAMALTYSADIEHLIDWYGLRKGSVRKEC